MRENIKNVGLILAIIIAGVSLPTSIMSFTNNPTTPITEINNYYYEENYYGNNETEIFTVPLQIWEFIDVEQDETFFTVNYTIDCKNWLYISGNETLGNQEIQLNIYLVNWVNMGNYRLVAQFEITSGSYISEWSPKVSGEYMITFRSYATYTRDIKIYFEIVIGD
jgi:hypothetical protein